MRFLIVGATGYIGQALVELLILKGHTVANLGRKTHQCVEVINFDIRTELLNIVENYRPDVVIYLAACFDDSVIEELIEVNVVLPLKILTQIDRSRSKTKFIYIGSYWQLGDKSKPDVPIDLYSASKKSFESYLQYYCEYRNLDCCEIILYGTYGDNDGRGKLLDILIKSSIANECIELSPGNQKLNLVHIEDVVNRIYGIAFSQHSPHFKRFSVYSSREYTPRELVNLINGCKQLRGDFGARRYRETEVMNPVYISSDEDLADNLEEYVIRKLSHIKNE